MEPWNLLSLPLPKRRFLVVAPRAANDLMLELAARLALNAPLRILDGGNRANLYPLARAIRRQTPRVHEALGRVRVARAFTCYQMLSLLEDVPAEAGPTLVLDLLATFYDESVSLDESRMLLRQALRELARLSAQAPVVISASRPPEVARSREGLLDLLERNVDQSWVFELPPAEPAPQLALWPEFRQEDGGRQAVPTTRGEERYRR